MLELGKGSREECGRGMVCHDEGLASSQGKQRFSSESVRSREAWTTEDGPSRLSGIARGCDPSFKRSCP